MDKTAQIPLPEDIDNDYKTIAKEMGISKATLMRMMLIQALRKMKADRAISIQTKADNEKR